MDGRTTTRALNMVSIPWRATARSDSDTRLSGCSTMTSVERSSVFELAAEKARTERTIKLVFNVSRCRGIIGRDRPRCTLHFYVGTPGGTQHIPCRPDP